MNTTTICGPLKDKESAYETMRALGECNHSVFSTEKDGVEEWFVERLNDVLPDKILGYDANEFMRRQHKAR